jgi:hypothetical protein
MIVYNSLAFYTEFDIRLEFISDEDGDRVLSDELKTTLDRIYSLITDMRERAHAQMTLYTEDGFCQLLVFGEVRVELIERLFEECEHLGEYSSNPFFATVEIEDDFEFLAFGTEHHPEEVANSLYAYLDMENALLSLLSRAEEPLEKSAKSALDEVIKTLEDKIMSMSKFGHHSTLQEEMEELCTN